MLPFRVNGWLIICTLMFVVFDLISMATHTVLIVWMFKEFNFILGHFDDNESDRLPWSMTFIVFCSFGMSFDHLRKLIIVYWKT